MPVPLLPIHILWINLVTDGLPALALAFEPAEGDIMRRPPRPPADGIFAGSMGWRILGLGMFTSAASVAAQIYAEWVDARLAQTMVFTVLTLAQMSLVLSVRAERESLVQHGLLVNPLLIGAVLLVVTVQLAIVYLPMGNAVFNTVPLGGLELAVCFGLAAAVLAVGEAEKWLRRRLRP
jgi:Ca2+-transporting ATPase